MRPTETVTDDLRGPADAPRDEFVHRTHVHPDLCAIIPTAVWIAVELAIKGKSKGGLACADLE